VYQPRARGLLLAAAGHQLRRARRSRGAGKKKRRSQVLRGHAQARSRLHRVAKLGRVERILVDKQADSQCSGYTADYTRWYLPAGGAARGEFVEVRCEELHADGIGCVTSS
jgi:tRNA A37 methylthiotransferase MiaB